MGKIKRNELIKTIMMSFFDGFQHERGATDNLWLWGVNKPS